MFNERISLVFKKLRVVRMVDRKRNTLVYLTYSDRVIEGSPQNSVTAVPVDRATPIPVRDARALSGGARSARRGRGTTWASVAAEPRGVGDLDGEGHAAVPPPASLHRLRLDAGDVHLLLGEHLGDVAQQPLAVARLDAARRPGRAPAAPRRRAPGDRDHALGRARAQLRASCCSRRGGRRRPCRA